ncbi:MAG: DUF2207 domain-containing protein [Candidatus Diapherotrites archaeon]|nr:DUF2207 domain-containing protein [Candidatus Diapherotrites archaeon]
MPEDLKSQEYFTEPPYPYRPSIAEYLTKMEVTRDGFIADILHLDKKKNINIEKYDKDSLVIKLVSDKDLNDTEVFLWNFLKKLEKGGIAELNPKKIQHTTLWFYSFLVRNKTVDKFSSGIKLSFGKGWGLSGESAFVPVALTTIIIGFFFGLLTLWLWPLFVLFGLVRVARAPSETRNLLRKFIWRYTVVLFKSLAFFVIVGLSVFPVIVLPFNYFVMDLGISLLDTGSLFLVLPSLLLLFLDVAVFFLSMFLLFSYPCYHYGAVFVDYLNWVFEKKEASENRLAWLKFKAFVCKYSELEKKPLKHYELWGEFYYYALAVGAIKNPKVV